jgi:hypothetical protein
VSALVGAVLPPVTRMDRASLPVLTWGGNTALDPHALALGSDHLITALPQTFHGVPRFVIWPSALHSRVLARSSA